MQLKSELHDLETLIDQKNHSLKSLVHLDQSVKQNNSELRIYRTEIAGIVSTLKSKCDISNDEVSMKKQHLLSILHT